MSPLSERFEQPLPSWIEEIKEEVDARISGANFIAACRTGDLTVLRNLVVGLWPFVDEFPRIVKRGCLRLCMSDLFYRFGPGKMLSLLLRSYKTLTEIEKDEEEHRKLWLRTGVAIELNYQK